MRPNTRAPDLCPALLSLAVHELRAPATVVAGYIGMLLRLRGDTLTDEQRKLAQGAERSCRQLTELLSGLADVSRLAAGNVTFRRADVALFPLVAEVTADLPVPCDPAIRVQVRGASTQATVIGDPDWLRLALRGLFSAPLRERVEPGVLMVGCAVRREGGRGVAVVAAGDTDAVAALLRATPSRWGPLDQWRAGLGFVLPVARLVIDAHAGRAGAPRGPKSRAAVAVALPLKRQSAGTKSARRGA